MNLKNNQNNKLDLCLLVDNARESEKYRSLFPEPFSCCTATAATQTALLQADDADEPGKTGLELLPKKVREQFMEVAEMVTELQQRAEQRLKGKKR